MNTDPQTENSMEEDKEAKPEIAVTDHAYMRIKKRMGLSREAAVRMAEKAFDGGISHSETSGRLAKYIARKSLEYKKSGTRIVIYGEMVYCFCGARSTGRGGPSGILVTVWYIPNNLKKNVLGLQKRKSSNLNRIS
ncbi:MAG: hypothetical protein J5718_06055 [Lachnospiraceae bacterium]|nr:hypothetical protein [Lachnospiraceae bacterium]